MARLGRSRPNVPIIERNTLADDPVLTTPRPVVVTRNPDSRFRARSRAQVVRSSLDNGSRPVLVVSKKATAAPRTGRTIIVQAPAAEEIIVVPPGPQIFVITSAQRTPVKQSPIVTRTPMAELAAPGTQTFVVTPVRRDRPGLRPLVIRSPLAEEPPSDIGPGTQALVVTPKPRFRSYSPTRIVRAPVETVAPPVLPETNPDLCAYPPIITWYAETPVIMWFTGGPTTGWLAGPPEDGC